MECQPWRRFRWRDGQKHYSGEYWSATVGDSVIYESLLELANLRLADYDRAVTHIAAQPFLLSTTIQGRSYRHVPDYLLLKNSRLTVVDVKPRGQLSLPKVEFALGWAKEVVEAAGWDFEIRSEPDTLVSENIKFLAGYRRARLFPEELIVLLRSGVVDGLPLRAACTMVPGWAPERIRAALLHLLWLQEFEFDPATDLRPDLILRRRVS